jgi:hypothetical protein
VIKEVFPHGAVELEEPLLKVSIESSYHNLKEENTKGNKSSLLLSIVRFNIFFVNHFCYSDGLKDGT